MSLKLTQKVNKFLFVGQSFYANVLLGVVVDLKEPCGVFCKQRKVTFTLAAPVDQWNSVTPLAGMCMCDVPTPQGTFNSNFFLATGLYHELDIF